MRSSEKRQRTIGTSIVAPSLPKDSKDDNLAAVINTIPSLPALFSHPLPALIHFKLLEVANWLDTFSSINEATTLIRQRAHFFDHQMFQSRENYFAFTCLIDCETQ
jgi:hypothetical protein